MTDKKYIEELEKLIKYQEAYDIFMDVFDKLPDSEKRLTHFRLKGIGL